MPEGGGHMLVAKYASDGERVDGIELVRAHSSPRLDIRLELRIR